LIYFNVKLHIKKKSGTPYCILLLLKQIKKHVSPFSTYIFVKQIKNRVSLIFGKTNYIKHLFCYKLLSESEQMCLDLRSGIALISQGRSWAGV